MKLRLIALVILLSLVLAACSFASDITPPATLSFPTAEPATAVPTATSVPTLTPTHTSAPVATDSGTTPAATDSGTPSAQVSPTPELVTLTIHGTVTAGSGSLSDGMEATLLLYDTTSSQVTQTLTAPITSDGVYEFTGVPAFASTTYFVEATIAGVTYNSNPVTFDGTTLDYSVPLTVYASTDDLNVLGITQIHFQFDFSTAGMLNVMAIYVLTNPGPDSVIVPTDGTSIPFILIPTGAQNVQFQLSQNSAPLISALNGFAMIPGADKQYGIITTFSLPYKNKLIYTQSFNLPVTATTIIVPEGVKVRSDQLTDAGTQTFSSVDYHLWQGASLATGSTLTLTVSGMPGDKPGFSLNPHTWLLIGVAAVGLILIGLGIFLFFRDRKLRRMEDEMDEEDAKESETPDAIGNDRDAIMDAIIALDDKFKAGEITQDAYATRRNELKDRLKDLP